MEKPLQKRVLFYSFFLFLLSSHFLTFKQWEKEKDAYVRAYRLFLQHKKEKAEKAWKKFLSIQPCNGAGYFYLGEIYRVQGDRKKAIEYYKKSAEIVFYHSLTMKNLIGL